jgi:hypothetical protein
MKIERLHSNYQEEERLYSTGNEELDELMERAFCEGYEYAQKEFAKKSMKEFKDELKNLSDEELNKLGWDNFKKSVGHSVAGGIDASIAGGLTKTLLDKNATGKLAKSKAGRVALGTLAAAEYMKTGIHGKQAIGHGRASRAVKLEKRRRRKEQNK